MFRTSKLKRAQKWLFSAVILLLFAGCQKDDICPQGTETTPMLVIEFYDAADPSSLKAVSNLVVIASGKEERFFGPTTANTVSIPLKTDETFTEYRFILANGSPNENEDIVTFTYTPTPVYLNRACGFKIAYENLDVTVTSDEDNWILGEIVLQENVENETAAHISFTH
jgi:hypothetical protein